MSKNLMLLSNSSIPGQPFFGWPKPHVQNWLPKGTKFLFIPFAGFYLGYDEYEKIVRKPFEEMGYELTSIHHDVNPIQAIENAEAVAVGGGNTFYLADKIQRLGLYDTLKSKVENGTPYIGWSAGANLCCPTIFTTNDMPIVEPPSFKGLDLFPFQINAHYTDETLDGHGGESRDQRLKECLIANQHLAIVGLREQAFFHLSDGKLTLDGNKGMRLFKYNEESKDYNPKDDVSFLLNNA